MPKKKKTLKQKMQTDQRRQKVEVQPVLTTSVATKKRKVTPQPVASEPENTFSLPQKFSRPHAKPVLQVQSQAISTNAYNHLSRDLFKTLFLTTSIIVAEILIKFFVERG